MGTRLNILSVEACRLFQIFSRCVYCKLWASSNSHSHLKTMNTWHQWNKPVSQSCTVAKSETFWWVTRQQNLADKRLATAKASKFKQSLHNWLVEQSSILSAKFDCPVRGPSEFFAFSYSGHYF